MSIIQPRLLADIGGTNARFAIEISRGVIENIEVLACNDFDNIYDALRAYLKNIDLRPHNAALAIAHPVNSDFIKMTNNHWAFSIQTLKKELNFKSLIAINDFTAQAYGITRLKESELVQIRGKKSVQDSTKVIFGPGTGLGVSAIVPCNNDFAVMTTLGGHVNFSPFDDLESSIWEYARNKLGHISSEHFLSGSGIRLIYEALANIEGKKDEGYVQRDITNKALLNECSLCKLTLDVFCSMLGVMASNLALTFGALGGIYICGGIIPRFIQYFKNSSFNARFISKSKVDFYLLEIPVYVVLSKYNGIYGASLAFDREFDNLYKN